MCEDTDLLQFTRSSIHASYICSMVLAVVQLHDLSTDFRLKGSARSNNLGTSRPCRCQRMLPSPRCILSNCSPSEHSSHDVDAFLRLWFNATVLSSLF